MILTSRFTVILNFCKPRASGDDPASVSESGLMP